MKEGLIVRVFNRYSIFKIIRNVVLFIVGVILLSALATMVGLKLYTKDDHDSDRGAIASDRVLPVYLDQGWNESDSLWFYNTTQGSALLPYDFFLALEQPESAEPLKSPANMDRYRYLAQKATESNPDALPVGFAKESYKGVTKWYQFFRESKDYVGFTCAACHTGQIDYTKNPSDTNSKTVAIRVDGAPAMADMVGFLIDLEKALEAVGVAGEKQSRFVDSVIALNNDFDSKEDVLVELKKWTETTSAYNEINYSDVKYGHGRLDAFGRIYNRVLRYVISTEQAKKQLSLAVRSNGERILEQQQLDKLFEGIESDVIIGDRKFALVFSRIKALGFSLADQIILRDQVFNPANAPVSYPYLWDIVQSTYVQWNGLADNANVGPLGRNVGEVIGVFGILDWTAVERSASSWWRKMFASLSEFVTGQSGKEKYVTFDSSIDVFNLHRLERKLRSLKSPEWPIEHFGMPDEEMVDRGEIIYNKYCLSCHEVIVRDDYDRLVISKMFSTDLIQTDPAMAENSVNYKGQSGNFKYTYQKIAGVGKVAIEEEAPVVQLLTKAAAGVTTTPDRDKWFFQRWGERVYDLVASIADNPISESVKVGDFKADTPSKPFNSLLSYKSRSLNGIWATAPYLHNGSVPTLYDLLLPARRDGDPAGDAYRPEQFYVGSREFDPKKIGFITDQTSDGVGTIFNVRDDNGRIKRGNSNLGHEYAAGKTRQADGKLLPPLNESERWDLLEYLKTL